MIYYPVQALVRAGITDILVVTGVEHIGDIVSQLRSGEEHGCRFTYRVQERPLGIADALSLAEDFARGEPVVVVLGDNIFDAPLAAHLAAFTASGAAAQIHLHRVGDPQRFGCPRFDGARLVEIIEKPDDPPSDFAVTGIYIFDAQVYGFIQTLTPSPRGELEISDINNRYLSQGTLRHTELTGYWTDAGTHASLALANQLVSG
ncbi:MAG: glucose-1-phosphate thymidylyltransferase [Myxococcota bacterium]|jgi:glucose-1-phosphate thymidylyltransferase